MKNIISFFALSIIASTCFAITPPVQTNSDKNSSLIISRTNNDLTNKDKVLAEKEHMKREDNFQYNKDHNNEYKYYTIEKSPSKKVPKPFIEQIENKNSINPLSE